MFGTYKNTTKGWIGEQGYDLFHDLLLYIKKGRGN